MASGIRLFTDPHHHNNGMRLSYSDNFSTEFLFRNSASHPFSQVQFIPERIMEFSMSEGGLRFYKVQWHPTWVPEHQLLQYHSIVEVFWQTQHELNLAAVSTSNQSSKPVVVSENDQSNESSTNRSNKVVPTPTDVTNQPTASQPSENIAVSTASVTTLTDPKTDCLTTSGNESDASDGPDDPHDEEPPVVKPSENELRKVISQVKSDDSLTVQCDGFNIVNVKNRNASEDELRSHAREVLGAFKKKRLRGPKGAANQPTACFFCSKILSSRKHLRKHQFSVHLKNIGEYPCHLCEKRFAYQSKLRAHLLVHSDNRSFACEVCGLTCKRLEHLQKHMKVHNKECNYRCDVCHKNFKVQAELKTHCLNEHKNQVNTCNVCKQSLQTGYSVYMHSLRHSGTREFSCAECGASFKSKHHLTAHQKTHSRPSPSSERIKCPACDEEFIVTSCVSQARVQFRKHMELAHKELASFYRYEYVCTICNKDFAYKGYLDEHMRSHAEETPEELKTRLKKRQKKVEFMSDSDIAKLGDKVEKITNETTGEVKLRCRLCPKREFRLISTVEKHIEEHESGKFDKAERIESMSEKDLAKLDDMFEKITHEYTGEMKLRCKLCPRREFRLVSALEKHIEEHENGKIDKTGGKCTICDRTFSSEARLLRHQRIHEPRLTNEERQLFLQSQKRKRKQQLPMKCDMLKKTAGKRTAALTAKSKLRIQTEEILYEESEDEEVDVDKEMGVDEHGSNDIETSLCEDSKNDDAETLCDENKNTSKQNLQKSAEDAGLSLPKAILQTSCP